MTNNRGDTLIEIIFAFAIISFIIATVINLSNAAFRQTIIARERAQASLIAQGQSEALRNIRDNSSSWSEFYGSINCSGNYHVLPQLDEEWVMTSGQGSAEDIFGEEGLNLYTVNIICIKPASNPHKVNFLVEVTWPALGGGPEERTATTLVLANIFFDRTITGG